MDESPKQLIDEVASTPIKQGQEAGIDYEYVRQVWLIFSWLMNL
jgi:hypothetical protein